MFKYLDIRLTGPICGCQTEDVRWNVVFDNGPVLVVHCGLCMTQLLVRDQNFRAAIILDKPYPKPKKTKASADARESRLHEADDFLGRVAALLPPKKKKP